MNKAIPLVLAFFFSCGPSAEEQYKKVKRETDSLDKISAQLVNDVLNPNPNMGDNKIICVKDIVVNVMGLSNGDLINACNKISNDCDSIFAKGNYDGSLVNVIKGVSVFYEWGHVIGLCIDTKNEALIKEQAQPTELKIRNVQLKYFPILREKFAKQLQKILWEEDYKIYVRGERNERLVIIHNSFVKNRNIKDFNELISQSLIDFRFEKAEYNWCKGCGDPEIIETEHLSDDKIGSYD